MRALLPLRALFFVALLPGTVTGYVPFLILRSRDRLHPPPASPSTIAAGVLLAIGISILLRCVWDFLVAGKGTLAPVDPPTRLVVRGLYRFNRNPMYFGVLTTLIAEAWLFRDLRLLAYAALIFLLVHLFVVFYEERTLARRFGDHYAAYRRAVPRWGIAIHPYPGDR